MSTDTLLSKFVFCPPPTVAISAVPVTFGAVNVFGISKLVPLSRTIFVTPTVELVFVFCNNNPFSSLSSRIQ